MENTQCDLLIFFKVTFGAGQESYAAMRTLDVRGGLDVEFLFKTEQPDGRRCLKLFGN